MKKRLFLFPVVLVSVLFVITSMISCSDDGADGVNGADGAQGPAGPEGPAGETGSGDIVYSEWLDVAFAADTIHTSGGSIDTIGYYATVNVPELTVEMLTTADVKMYINASDAVDPAIYSLPYNGSNGLYIQMSASKETISLYSNSNIGTVADNNGVKYQQFRYMIIPGNVSAGSRSSLDWSDYNAVKNYLGLKN